MLSRPLSLVSITFLDSQKVFFPSVRANKVCKAKKGIFEKFIKTTSGCFFFEDKLCQFVYIKKPQGTIHIFLQKLYFDDSQQNQLSYLFLQLCSQYCIGNYVFQEAAFLETWEITLLDPLDLQQYRATVSYLCIELPMQACRASPLFDGDN